MTTPTQPNVPVGLKPMLASPLELDKIRYPVIVQPKYDGIRALIVNGQALSRTLKPIPNKYIQSFFKEYAEDTHGLDGELFVGDSADPKVFQATTSGVMSHEGTPNFKFIAFDWWLEPANPYHYRKSMVNVAVQDIHELHAKYDQIDALIDNPPINNDDELFRIKDLLLESGYEGAIVRHPGAPYKYGRSRASDGALIKFKDFTDEEATVIGFQQFYHNDNEALTDNLGHSKRSSHQANKRPAEMLGALIVQSPNWPSTFCIGSGFDMVLRQKSVSG